MAREYEGRPGSSCDAGYPSLTGQGHLGPRLGTLHGPAQAKLAVAVVAKDVYAAVGGQGYGMRVAEGYVADILAAVDLDVVWDTV